MSKSTATAKRSSSSAAQSTAVVKSAAKQSAVKLLQQSDNKVNRAAVTAAINKVAAKLRDNRDAKLKLDEAALCVALKFRKRLATKVSLDTFFEKLNSETKMSSHKSSTFVSKYNSSCKAEQRMTDFRYALYQVTVALYEKSSQFAADFICFSIETSKSTAAHSNKVSNRTVSVQTCKVLNKVAALKSLADDVSLLTSKF